jgi:hypothetical protein
MASGDGQFSDIDDPSVSVTPPRSLFEKILGARCVGDSIEYLVKKFGCSYRDSEWLTPEQIASAPHGADLLSRF